MTTRRLLIDFVEETHFTSFFAQSSVGHKTVFIPIYYFQ